MVNKTVSQRINNFMHKLWTLKDQQEKMHTKTLEGKNSVERKEIT